ncbi:MAG: Hsp20 family protein [Alphaproteobacteria bacterium]|nr:Hsp20 family protein [Alphaproteobacteria bacterium]
MLTFDFSPLFRSTVGFDGLARVAEEALRFGDTATAYPPYNIERTGNDGYQITMAVAGFNETELAVEAKENALVVAGRKGKKTEDESRYLYHGIAGRDFVRRFHLADYVKVVSASIENGLLRIELLRELPEAMKSRRIEIKKANGSTLVDQAKKLIDAA